MIVMHECRRYDIEYHVLHCMTEAPTFENIHSTANAATSAKTSSSRSSSDLPNTAKADDSQQKLISNKGRIAITKSE